MPRSAWQRAALRAAMLTAAYAILSLEILSLFRIVTGLGLGIAWVAATIGAGTFALIAWKERGIPRPDRWAPPASAAEWFLAAGVILVLVITAIVAYFAPPQTWDSLNYHMSRVAHWAQEAAVVPFATGIEVQNSMTPGAEMAGASSLSARRRRSFRQFRAVVCDAGKSGCGFVYCRAARTVPRWKVDGVLRGCHNPYGHYSILKHHDRLCGRILAHMRFGGAASPERRKRLESFSLLNLQADSYGSINPIGRRSSRAPLPDRWNSRCNEVGPDRDGSGSGNQRRLYGQVHIIVWISLW